MSHPDPQQRIEDLECRYAHIEATIEALEDSLVKQATDIERLQIQNRELHKQLQDFQQHLPDDPQSGDAVFERPPHY